VRTQKLDRKNQKKAVEARPGEAGRRATGANESTGTDANDEEVKFVFTVVPE